MMGGERWWLNMMLISGLIGMVLLIRPFPAQAQGIAQMGFVRANKPTTASYTPEATRAYNSANGAISITRNGIGVYDVRFSGLDGDGAGHVQVTATGNNSHTCKVNYWQQQGSDAVVKVLCFAASGASIDTTYNVLILWPDIPPTRPQLVGKICATGEVCCTPVVNGRCFSQCRRTRVRCE